MENTVNLSLSGGEDSPDNLSKLAEHHPVPIHRSPAPPLDADMKESTRPTLTDAIYGLVRLRQLAQAASEGLPAYNANAHGLDEK